MKGCVSARFVVPLLQRTYEARGEERLRERALDSSAISPSKKQEIKQPKGRLFLNYGYQMSIM